MTNAIASVIVASASAVAKVFAIGAIGYAAATRPRPVPILPPQAMDAVSKMNFDLLILPLVYTALASGVTPEALGSLWFVLASGVGNICLSYGVSTLLERLPCFRVVDRTDFDALRIAAAFPNIVALPILIFPALCEFTVVYDAFYDGEGGGSEAEKFRSCVDRSNAMIFVYFLAWNLLFWILGYPKLVAAGQKRQSNRGESPSSEEPHCSEDSFMSQEVKIDVHADDENGQGNLDWAIPDEDKGDRAAQETKSGIERMGSASDARKSAKEFLHLFANAFMKTVKSPGFVAMFLGIVTACIPPLRDALFSPDGALRFLGSALESLGRAGAPVGTLIVAASLVHQAEEDAPSAADGVSRAHERDAVESDASSPENNARRRGRGEVPISDAEPAQHHSDNLRESMRRRRSSASQMGAKAIAAIRRRKPTIRMHSWFVSSRLIVSPAVVCLILVALDCGGTLDGIPSLAMAKTVVIVNAGLPGAQMIIITLRSRGLSDSASVAARVYLPSYLLSVVTIAAWTSLALMISIPSENGSSFCRR